MRVISMAMGLAIVLAGCGGEKKAEEQAAPPEQQAPAPAATAGATHDVNMVLDAGAYKYEPAEVTINSGDIVRFHNVSGAPHNVSFWTDSIPAGAQGPLGNGMADQMGPLQGPLLTEADAVYTVTFAGAPAGEYKYFCLPHLALGMTGKITVQ